MLLVIEFIIYFSIYSFKSMLDKAQYFSKCMECSFFIFTSVITLKTLWTNSLQTTCTSLVYESERHYYPKVFQKRTEQRQLDKQDHLFAKFEILRKKNKESEKKTSIRWEKSINVHRQGELTNIGRKTIKISLICRLYNQ